ncbi:MAG TPA: RNA polymerase sigma factor [Longimicrobium sp.]|nr:RNA polymerase sigma factor [Longimicrobium sp.]
MPDTDAALVARALDGDADGFETLVRRHFRAAYAVALALTREPADADDVCQDAFVRAYERLADCREPAKFAAWLAQIVRNRARNRLAYFRIRRALPLSAAEHRPAGGASPAVDAAREELRRALLAALGGLPAIQREVVILHDLEGMKHGEIAALVACSEGMSRRHLSDARRVLRGKLADRYRRDDDDG